VLIAAFNTKPGEKVVVPTMSAKDLKDLKDALQKCEELEQRVSKLELEKADKRDLEELKKNFAAFSKRIDELKASIARLSQGDGVEEGALNELRIRMDHLANELNALREDLQKWMREMQE